MLVLALSAAALLSCVYVPPTGAKSAVKVLPTAAPSLASAKTRPTAVEWLMTGDYMTKLRWRKWGHARATATGVYHLNRCQPCTKGPYKRMRGKLTLSRIVTCRGVRLYTSASTRYLLHGHWRKTTGLGEPANPCDT